MERRTFMAMLTGGIVVAPFAAEAQQAVKIARIGYLSGSLDARPYLREAFLEGLRDLGYVDLRALLTHRMRLVRIRTMVKNGLHAIALNYRLARGSKLLRQAGLA